jgi:molybdopterin-binding protein
MIKWLDIVAGRRISQRNFKKSTLHEIPTVINGLVVSKMEDNMPSSNLNTSHMCKISATKPENKDHKIIIIGVSHA